MVISFVVLRKKNFRVKLTEESLLSWQRGSESKMFIASEGLRTPWILQDLELIVVHMKRQILPKLYLRLHFASLSFYLHYSYSSVQFSSNKFI